MSIVLHHRRTDERPANPPRVPPFEEVRMTTTRNEDREVTTGPTAGFDWGYQLPPMTMAQIAALEPAEWETAEHTARTFDPMPDLRAATAMELACYEQTNYVLDDISVVLDQLAKLLRPLAVAVPGEHHAARMLVTAYYAERNTAAVTR